MYVKRLNRGRPAERAVRLTERGSNSRPPRLIESLRIIGCLRVGELERAGRCFHGRTEVHPCVQRRGDVGATQFRYARALLTCNAGGGGSLAYHLHQMPDLIIDLAGQRDRMSNFLTQEVPVSLAQPMSRHFDVRERHAELLRQIRVPD